MRNDKTSMGYLKNDKDYKKTIRTEILFTPMLIILPFVVGFFLIFDWYLRDFSSDELDLMGELILGLVIIIANIVFDIPFVQSLLKSLKNK